MENFRKKNKSWDEETPMRVDEDLNQESVTDAMRGDNNITQREEQSRLDVGKKKSPAEES